MTMTKGERLEVGNVECGPANGDRVGLSCVHGGARYHVWLHPATMDPGGTLYKNPPRGVSQLDDGYFHTRKLGVSSRFALSLIASMLEVYRRDDLLGRFKAEQAREEADRQARNAERDRVHRITMAAEDLYDACKVALKAIAGHDAFQSQADALGRAIQKAEGKTVAP